MAYAYPGNGAIDYAHCRYGNSRLLFRGPPPDRQAPYCAVLGGTATYGKFLQSPFSVLLSHRTGWSMANLGLMNAGLDAYLNEPEVLAVLRGAHAAVVQVVGAANLSNRYYTVHPRRNDRFVCATPALRALFREVDFTEFHFTRHLLQGLHAHAPDRFEHVAAELRTVWTDRMHQLLTRLPRKSVLLWMASHPPPSPGQMSDLSRDPLLVDASMIGAVRSGAGVYLEQVFSEETARRELYAKSFEPMQRPAAQEVPGPTAHREVAEALAGALQMLE